MAYAKLHKTFSHREVEDQEIGRVHHVLVEGDHADHEQVADEAGDDDDGEEDGDEDGHNLLQDLQIHRLSVEGCHVVQSPAGIHVDLLLLVDIDVEVVSDLSNVLHLETWPTQH